MSTRWYQKHVKDPFVKKANKEGMRSRAAYKLLEIQKKKKIVQKGDSVVDLGSSPGAWSEALVSLVGKPGKVVACDLLEMKPIKGVAFIQGDFLDPLVQEKIAKVCDRYQVVVSDMAPNLTGNPLLDQANMADLIEMVLVFSSSYLIEGGSCIVKGFHGERFEELLKLFRKSFKRVKVFKPEASRSESKEIYFIGEIFHV